MSTKITVNISKNVERTINYSHVYGALVKRET